MGEKKRHYIKLIDATNVIGGYCSSPQDMKTLLWHMEQLEKRIWPEQEKLDLCETCLFGLNGDVSCATYKRINETFLAQVGVKNCDAHEVDGGIKRMTLTEKEKKIRGVK